MDANQEAQEVYEGGTWKDENLAESIEWAGDKGSSSAAVDSNKTHIPKTHGKIEEEILTAAQVTTDVLNTIVARVERSLLKSSGSSANTLTQMVEGRLKTLSDETKTWFDNVSSRISKIEEQTKDQQTDQVSKLNEKIASLEFKLDSIAGAITQHGPEEARMIQEAYRIITERRSSDADDVSDPSIITRLEKRTEVLRDSAIQYEPFVDSAIKARTTEINDKARVLRKFGRRY
jgi:outer membrane murein-binding lipoprotein Lpp